MISRLYLISLIFIGLFLFILPVCYGQPFVSPYELPNYIEEEGEWVENTLLNLSLEQQIAQLFMIAVDNETDTEGMISKFQPGGIILAGDHFFQHLTYLNRWQLLSQVPLLVGQDAYRQFDAHPESESQLIFPQPMTMGGIQHDSILYEVGKAWALQLRRLGVHINFAPVMDIAHHPYNPSLNIHSLGQNKFNVARKGILLARGMQDHGIIACTKHFPGTGSSYLLDNRRVPIIQVSTQQLDTIDLYPFQQIIEAGIGACMVGHVQLPHDDPYEAPFASLSPYIVKELLKEKINFRGLLISDALNLPSVSQRFPDEELAIRAFMAGHDILLAPNDIEVSIQAIKQAIDNGIINQYELEERVKRVLSAKYKLGLTNFRKVEVVSSQQEWISEKVKILVKKLYESAITVPINKGNLLPLKRLNERKVAYIQVGGKSENNFDKTLQKYGYVETFYLRKAFKQGELLDLLEKVSAYDTYIVGVFEMNSKAKEKYGIQRYTLELCKRLTELPHKETILTLFGSPYSMIHFGRENAVVVAYEDHPAAYKAAAEAIYGGIPISGKMPVDVSSDLIEGSGYQVPEAYRLQEGYPEEVGMDSYTLRKIDSLTSYYIDQKAMPGCAVLVARGNQIVYAKGFGTTNGIPRKTEIDPFVNTYDLASLTKVMATTLAIMKLTESGKLDLDAPISTYFPELKETNKARITARRLLLHTAGLPSWIPFFVQTYSNQVKAIHNPKILSRAKRAGFNVQISHSLYVADSFRDSMWQQIIDVPVSRSRRARYSDLGMIILGELVERIVNKNLDAYVNEQFYLPLGMDHTYFNPSLKDKAEYCPPTQLDYRWRKGKVQGYVHDETAALLGGVAGHAGLFSNVYDLCKLLMVLKNEGKYADQQFFLPETIAYFTKQQLPYYRKGLGWDKPALRFRNDKNVSDYASPSTYGHTGFTGTAAWVDPHYDLIYIFLSNRTYPSVENRLFSESEIRKKVMDKIYESIAMYDRKMQLSGKAAY